MAADTAIQKTSPQTVEIKSGSNRPRSTWSYRPHVDIFDTPEALQLIADLPGADPQRIDVVLESGILTLAAVVPPRPVDGAQSVMCEYGVGNYHRRFEIDDSIDAEAVTAEYRDGCLTVHLPKTRQARRRRIPVSA
ncbi:MAG: Hsp20/alpha crystallin family protein [Planctomycetota bacterium]|jgi:HSP20 family protein